MCDVAVPPVPEGTGGNVVQPLRGRVGIYITLFLFCCSSPPSPEGRGPSGRVGDDFRLAWRTRRTFLLAVFRPLVRATVAIYVPVPVVGRAQVGGSSHPTTYPVILSTGYARGGAHRRWVS